MTEIEEHGDFYLRRVADPAAPDRSHYEVGTVIALSGVKDYRPERGQVFPTREAALGWITERGR